MRLLQTDLGRHALVNMNGASRCRMHATRVVLVVAGLWGLGCTHETRTVVADDPDPWVEQREVKAIVTVPLELQDMSGFLLRRIAINGELPGTLEQLRTEGIMPMTGFARIDEFAYSPNGVGRLEDGRVILLVDHSQRIDGHLWCILREPVALDRTVMLQVVPVPIAQLRLAARDSS